MFKSIYTSLEKNFFNTLSKKLFGNLLFIAALQFAAIISFGLTKGEITAALNALPVERAAIDNIINLCSDRFIVPLVLMGITFAMLFFMMFFFTILIVRPIKKDRSRLRRDRCRRKRPIQKHASVNT